MIAAVSSFVREHTRYPVELAMRMTCSSWSDYLELYTSNLSRGGLFVGSRLSAPIGTEVSVELTLPDGKALAMRAEVVHVNDGPDLPGRVAGMGLMFIDLDHETRAAIEAMVRLARAQAQPIANAARAPKSQPPPPPPVAAVAAVVPSAPSPPPPTQARAPQFADVVEQALLDELGRRMDLAPHAQLGLSLAADDSELEVAYQRLRDRYAPAIFARYGESTAAVVKAINDALDSAHERLRDPSQRRALIVEGHAPKPLDVTPGVSEQKRRGDEARLALRAGIERRIEEACAHRDLQHLDDAIRGFEAVLSLDRKHDYAREELRKLREKRDQAAPKGGGGIFDRLRKR